MEDTIIEVREDFMLSPAGDSQPTFRTAHFLKPIANSIDKPSFVFNPSFSSYEFEPKEWQLKIHFNGWRYPHKKWVCWVDELKQKYESVWKKAGIFEAITSTKCKIKKNQDLVYGVVEKWCCESNTFVFSFGEATITLEDVRVLGGYSLFGDPVFTPLEDDEMKEVEKKLILARQVKSKSKKGVAPSTSMWMDIFINKGSEIEHEAFLATWLSIFVFPHKLNLVKSSLFPVAIHLARGNQIALAPAVLASLYKDLSLFKESIVGLEKCSLKGVRFPLELEVNLRSPFYLVQIWVWERFQNLQPQPKLINNGDHVLLKWDMVKGLEIDNVRLALDSAVDDFLWRSYVGYADKCGVFYPIDECWIPFKKDLNKEMLSFVTCLRVSELVGFDSIEQYLPHRVSMQFGMDQDVPSYVPRFNETKNIAWENYCRPISDRAFYFPSRFFEADVTARYTKWWKKSVLGRGDFVDNIVRRKRSVRSRKHTPHEVPPEFLTKLDDNVTFGKSCDDGSSPELLKNVPSENSVQDGFKADENIDADAPSSLTPKLNNLTPLVLVEYCKPVLEEKKCVGIINESNQLLSQFSSAEYEDFKQILPLQKPVTEENIELSRGVLEDEAKDENESIEERLSSDRISQTGTQGESYSYLSEENIVELELRISRLEIVLTKLKMERFGQN
ncbi:uncharacterized protein [Cicer arietinum]|uniref:uncharacterized protein n=1 Tax=Cicer arietinum TaxID=3827 RepID=UPI003CC6D67C